MSRSGENVWHFKFDGMGTDARNQIFRRMAFNVAASNHDDHSKNHSFLLRENGAWELSPTGSMFPARKRPWAM